MLSLLAAGEMLRPFNKSRRETESGNLGTVVGAVPGLYGSEGVSSEDRRACGGNWYSGS